MALERVTGHLNERDILFQQLFQQTSELRILPSLDQDFPESVSGELYLNHEGPVEGYVDFLGECCE